MKKFEYQEVEYSTYPSPEELNEEGIDGWELIHIFSTKRKYFDADFKYYFMKEIYLATFKREIYGKTDRRNI